MKTKNDSLIRKYAEGKEFIIYLKEKNNPASDTIPVLQNACYHLKSNDGNEAESGVVHKITMDSIYVSNTFNEAISKRNKKEYRIYNYAIADLSELRIFKFKVQKFRTLNFQITISQLPLSTKLTMVVLVGFLWFGTMAKYIFTDTGALMVVMLVFLNKTADRSGVNKASGIEKNLPATFRNSRFAVYFMLD